MSNLFQCHIVQSCLESCSSRDDERICTECIDIATTCYGGIPTPKLCFSNRLEHIHTFHTSGPVTQKLFFRFFILYNRCPLLLPKHIESRFLDPSWNTLEYIIARAGGARGLAFASAQTAKVPMFPRNASCFWYFFEKSDMHNISLIFFSYTWIFLASQTTNSN